MGKKKLSAFGSIKNDFTNSTGFNENPHNQSKYSFYALKDFNSILNLNP